MILVLRQVWKMPHVWPDELHAPLIHSAFFHLTRSPVTVLCLSMCLKFYTSYRYRCKCVVHARLHSFATYSRLSILKVTTACSVLGFFFPLLREWHDKPVHREELTKF